MTRFQGPHKPSHKSDGDLWLCDTNLTCLVNILNQEYHEVYQDIKQAVFFGKSFFYDQLMQVHNKDKNKANKFKYQVIVRQCKKAPGGSLLAVKSAYFPIHFGKFHWICVAILNKSKEIVLYNDMRSRTRSPNKSKHENILKNMLKLVVAEFRRTTKDHTSEDVRKFEKKWKLKDLSPQKDKTPSDLPEQLNGKLHDYK